MARDTNGTKARYKTPSLKVYGSVRDLTGNNSGGISDMNMASNGMGT